MGHSYYSYTKEELVGNGPKLPVIVMEDNAEVFHSMAVEMVDEIRKHNEKGEKTVFICPVGPVGQYPYFVDMVNEQNISLKNVWFINMDEYLDDEKQWISKDHPLSFRGFMQRTVYDKVRPELVMPEDQRVFPDPNHPEYISELIEKLGGVDICFGGIGINGHVFLRLQKKQEQLMRLVILMELWKTCLIIVLPLELMRFHMQGRFVWDVSETGTGQ